MTASPGASYQNDLLGNRTWKNYQQASVQRYVWDELGRLSSLCGTSQGAKYTYRVDGLRIKKVEGLTIEWVDDGSGESEEESSGYYDEHWATNKPTTRYFYDGQMSFEDDYTVVSGGFGTPDVTVTRYALGARGIDAIETTTSSGASAAYPVYDGHGNMIATLSRNGSSFTRANNRAFDAWGNITSGSGGDQGYVANLGHRRDVESGLTYMRARYYEPGTGRFISQDPAMDGGNWFAYCSNDPLNRVDANGEEDSWDYEDEANYLIRMGLGWIGVGVLHFAIGIATFYGVEVGPGATRFARVLVGATKILGVYVMVNGLRTMAAGIAILYAGKYLHALGEDGLDEMDEMLMIAADLMPFYHDWGLP